MTAKILSTLALFTLFFAHGAMAYYPNASTQQAACAKTGGQWRVLPPFCDNMHPRSWEKMSEEQQKQCMAVFNEPCECGSGKRFSVVNVLGCTVSNFPSDK